MRCRKANEWRRAARPEGLIGCYIFTARIWSMSAPKRLVKKALMVGVMSLGLLTPQRSTKADPPSSCGGCTGLYVCLYAGDLWCSQTCGKPFAGCTFTEECGNNMPRIVCEDPE